MSLAHLPTERFRPVEGEESDPRPPEFSDDALALRFAERHADDLRYCAAWARWLHYDGRRWNPDETFYAFDRARAICREAAAAAGKPNVAVACASAKTVAAVERLAKADRRHAASVDQWDADPWLLNTPAGVVDLRTGRLRPHVPTDHFTKITAVAPEGDCPLWQRFLARVTNGDAELQGFLQRMAGSALTGSTRDHALFFVYGTGRNGKGVFLNTLTRILADYAVVASIDTFTASAGDRHTTDLAHLRGARLVTAQETEEGRRWAEARIKALTGGDPITARFVRQDNFTFTPQFKLVIAGNHKPGLRNVDEAIRARFNLIPFTVTIPAAERDAELPEKLTAEWAGILAWMIEGAVAWGADGLRSPAAVRSATDRYLATEDALAQWIEDCCTTEPNDWGTNADLFASWREWADRSGESAGTAKGFGQKLEDRGLARHRAGKDRTRGFLGIAIKHKDMSDAHWNR